ncbi:hypothetical protein L6164_027390 [Bauhinia variegata]|uniref:Uncharacterized protein n=1 Tax=Bauhinia variegata TaxID=167791 RepID=A0ACB9LTZ2_BAUVA|nr:hypothetical protein L6164_027390 [Bauhinia variegata]
MATLESVLSVFASYRCSTKSFSSPKPPDSIKLYLENSHFTISRNSIFSSTLSSSKSSRRLCFELLCSPLQELATEERPEETQETNAKKKLYVFNLPWSFSVVDIKNLFGECGSVTDVEIIKKEDGKNRAFAFVTMASGEEAEAAIEKFDSHEVSGRKIQVELAKRFKKLSSPRPPGAPADETRHKVFASNLAWKVRSTHLRDFITEQFKKPASAKVVFESSTGRSAGYGFVSFVTKEDAEAAVSSLNGKELMGRPIILKSSQKPVEEAGSKKEEKEQGDDGQVEES